MGILWKHAFIWQMKVHFLLTHPEKAALLFAFYVFRVHQLASNCVCLLSAAEQVVYSGFLQLFLWKRHYERAESEPEH